MEMGIVVYMSAWMRWKLNSEETVTNTHKSFLAFG